MRHISTTEAESGNGEARKLAPPLKVKRREFSQSLLGMLAAASGAVVKPSRALSGFTPGADVKLTTQQIKLYQASLPPLESQLRKIRRFPLGYSDPPASVFISPPAVVLKPSRRP